MVNHWQNTGCPGTNASARSAGSAVHTSTHKVPKATYMNQVKKAGVGYQRNTYPGHRKAFLEEIHRLEKAN
jgi:hypothetical protein